MKKGEVSGEGGQKEKKFKLPHTSASQEEARKQINDLAFYSNFN